MNSNEYVHVYLLIHSAIGKTVRLLAIFFFASLTLYGLTNHSYPRFSIFFLCLLAMAETFFRYKINRYHPKTPVGKNNSPDVGSSATMPVLTAYLSETTSEKFLLALLRYPQILFILEKIGLDKGELSLVDIPKKDILQYSFELAKSVNGEYITTMDCLVSYLLLSEEKTKLLFRKKIKDVELMQILFWAQMEYPEEEHAKDYRVHFFGDGIGESLMSGWTPETKQYTDDFTYHSLNKRALIVGRSREYQEICEALAKKENNNIILVGEIGAGKESLVEALAYDSFGDYLSSTLNHKKILELMVGPLIAGAGDRGNMEVRLQNIIAEISHAGNVILYIPQFENIMGAGSYNLDLSGALLPYLKNGGMPIIATMTPGAYKAYLERSPMKSVFEIIQVLEPEKDVALQMLFEKAGEIEEKNGVSLTYRSVIAAANFADRYEQDANLPGSAVLLLTDSANRVAVTMNKMKRSNIVTDDDVISTLEEKTHANVAAPKAQEKELLLHLEEKLHERIIGQDDAITAISEAMRRVRSGLASANKPVSFLFLGPTGVGKTETARVLSDLYFGGQEHIVRLDMSEYSDSEGVKRLLGAAPGEGEERGELTDKIHDHPDSLVLLDEFEKANPRILDLFLQVLEDGRLTDNKGHTVSFVNAIIIATSNAGAEFIREEVEKGTQIDKIFQHRLMEYLQSNRIFKPELLNRFDDVVTFKSLSQDQVATIARLMLKSLTEKLKEQDIAVTFDDKIITKISQEGYDPEFGARPLRRYLQDKIEDLIAQKELRDEIKRGNNVVMTLDDSGNIQTVVS